MATTITATGSAATTEPLLVLGYQTSRTSRNEIHDLISGGIAVSLVAPRPRSGILELFYADEAEAFASLNLHAEETTFQLSDDSRPSVNMAYVIDGILSVALDDETREHWVVSVGYQEVEL